jgi:hypothetical protein
MWRGGGGDRVARIIDVAAIDLLSRLEEGRHPSAELLPQCRVADRSSLLLKLAPHRRRHRLVVVDHSTRERPLLRVAALD